VHCFEWWWSGLCGAFSIFVQTLERDPISVPSSAVPQGPYPKCETGRGWRLLVFPCLGQREVVFGLYIAAEGNSRFESSSRCRDKECILAPEENYGRCQWGRWNLRFKVHNAVALQISIRFGGGWLRTDRPAIEKAALNVLSRVGHIMSLFEGSNTVRNSISVRVFPLKFPVYISGKYRVKNNSKIYAEHLVPLFLSPTQLGLIRTTNNYIFMLTQFGVHQVESQKLPRGIWMVVLEYLTFSCTSTAHCQPYIPGYSLWSLAAKPDTDVNYNKQLNVIEYETQKEEVKVGHTFSFFDPQFLRTFSLFSSQAIVVTLPWPSSS